MKPRELIFDGDVAYVPLTRGHYATIDAEDAPLVEGSNWCAMSEKARMHYAVRTRLLSNGEFQTIFMHRLIAQAYSGTIVDHVNHDPIDNRKTNLRLCSYTENGQNSRKKTPGKSNLKGVCWHNQKEKWFARITVNKKQIYLGLYDTEEEAHKAYCEASEQMHKEYGCTVSYNQKNSVT